MFAAPEIRVLYDHARHWGRRYIRGLTASVAFPAFGDLVIELRRLRRRLGRLKRRNEFRGSVLRPVHVAVPAFQALILFRGHHHQRIPPVVGDGDRLAQSLLKIKAELVTELGAGDSRFWHFSEIP